MLGAGLAGLAAALTLSKSGRKVIIHEAANRAGGRCRSYHDPVLDRVIDNGNHLMMSANAHVFDYLTEVGARSCVAVTEPAAYPFVDVTTGELDRTPQRRAHTLVDIGAISHGEGRTPAPLAAGHAAAHCRAGQDRCRLPVAGHGSVASVLGTTYRRRIELHTG